MVLTRALGWLLIAALTVTFGGCAASSPPSVPDDQVLRVGVSTNAPPLMFKRDSQIAGLEADFARLLGEFLGKTVRFVELDWNEQIPALLNGKIDIIMSGMSITRLREVRIAFSKPYLRTGQMALIRAEDAARFRTGYYAIVKSAKVGFVKGTTGELFVKQNIHGGERVPYKTSRRAAEALKRKEIDLFIHDAPIVLMVASEHEADGLMPVFSLLTEEYLAWGLRKDDDTLRAAADQFLDTIQKDGRLDQMRQRWLPKL